MSLSFAREPLARLHHEMLGLMADHWQEVAHHQGTRTLDPDWPAFLTMEVLGQLYVLAVRDEGALVGYVIAVLRPHLHSRNTRTAYVDAVYLAPSARRGLAGYRLVRHVDAELEQLGADFIYWHVKPNVDFGPLLHRLGYSDVEAVLGRAVRRGG